jgi:transcriptional regulator with XRE-family HTH domain
MHLGNNIRSIRLFRGYSQEYVAKAIGISQNTYSRIERDEVPISEKRLIALSEVFELTVEDIREFDERTFKHEFVINEKNKAYFKAEQALIQDMRKQNALFRTEIAKFWKLLRELSNKLS